MKDFIATKWHFGGRDTLEDNLAIEAANNRDLGRTERNKRVAHWLQFYKVLRFFPPDRSTAIANEIIGFADEEHVASLNRDKDRIVSEFDKLKERIGKVARPNKNGMPPNLKSLTSKALWCCYPDDVPIFDKNAASALKVVSRLCHMVPAPKQSEYACFVDVWLQVYNEVEPVISPEDLSDCPYKVRVLDRLLWYLGQDSFYDEG